MHEMKLRVLVASVLAMSLTAGIATAQTAPAAKPAAPAAPAANPFAAAQAGVDKTTLSYAYGYEFGAKMVRQGTELDVATVVKAVQDSLAKRPPPANMAPEKLEAAVVKHQQQYANILKTQFEKISKENKTRSDAFMASNKAKPGVTTLPSGVQYRVIEAGAGAKPSNTNTVDIQFRASLAATNQVIIDTFSEAKPQTGKLNEIPWPGMREVLALMPSGARYEIFAPGDKAYGNDPRSPIGPQQAVKFEVSLISVK
jgi:FKBP-type peptidyl-prolyl cis-trans isomerase